MAKKPKDPKLIKALAEARAKKGPKVVKAFSTEAAEKETVKLVNKLVKSGSQGTIKLLTKGTATPQELVQLLVDKVNANVAYLKTYVDTGLSVIGRERIMEQAEDLGAKWYRYIGGTIATSREFCVERDGGYFTKEEIEGWADEDWDGKIEEGDSGGPGTNAETIFVYCGGWNCRHELIPVLEQAVPEDVKAFNEAQRKEAEATQERLQEAQQPAPTLTEEEIEAISTIPLQEQAVAFTSALETATQRVVQNIKATADEVITPAHIEEARGLSSSYDTLMSARNDANLKQFVSKYNDTSTAARELFIKEQARAAKVDMLPADAARSYVRNGYGEMNRLTRGDIDLDNAYWVESKLSEVSVKVREMDKFINDFGAPVKQTEFWRGVSNRVADDMKLGALVVDDGFLSTTSDREVALAFTNEKTGKLMDERYRTLFKLQVKPGAKAIDVEDLGFSPHNESEFIFPRSKRFVITGEAIEELPHPYNAKVRILTITEQ